MLKVRDLGLSDYQETWDQMKSFTSDRDETTEDELWLTEHHPVYTLGQAGKREHFLIEPQIPVVHSDRGGQLTYHGPGQIVGYTLVDLKRARISVHQFVNLLEQVMIDTVGAFGATARRMPKQPGVYVDGKKIGSLGLRVRRSRTYHGISLNVNMDLSPFDSINPCGMPGMSVTHLAMLSNEVDMDIAKSKFISLFLDLFQRAESIPSKNISTLDFVLDS